jgi:teichuronic acid exporter
VQLLSNLYQKLSKLINNLELKFITDVIWQASGNSIAQVISIFGLPILTRLYAPEYFGLYSYFLQMVLFFSGFLGYKFEYFIQQIARDSNAKYVVKIVVFVSIMLSIVSTIVFMLFQSKIFSFLQINYSSIFFYTPLIGLLVLYTTAIQHYLQRFEDFRSSGISEIILRFSFIVAALTFSFFGFNVEGLIVAFVVSNLIKLIFLIFHLKRFVDSINMFYCNSKKDLLKSIVIIKNYFRITSSAVTAHFLMMVTSFSPVIIFNFIYGQDFLGQYFLAYSVLYLPTSLVAMAVGKVYYQRASKLIAANDLSLIDIWHSVFRIIFFIGIIFLFIFFFFSQSLFIFLFGNEWALSGSIATILCFSTFCAFISIPFENTCLIFKKAWYPIFWHSLRAVLTLIFCAIVFLYKILPLDAIYLFMLINLLVHLIDLIMQRGFVLSYLKNL